MVKHIDCKGYKFYYKVVNGCFCNCQMITTELFINHMLD